MRIAGVPQRHSVHAPLQEQVRAMDWECENDDTRYLTHGIHRYSGKFIPQIARQAIELLTDREDLILDPFCGSGTTLLEAYISGRRAIGIDLNPLAVLLARIKCTPIHQSRLDCLMHTLDEAVWDIRNGETQRTLFSKADSLKVHSRINSDPRLKDIWYRKWFDDVGLYQLIGVHQAVEELQEPDLKDLALAAFSDILRRCSHARGGYPNVMYDKRRLPRPEPAPLFLLRLRDFCDAIGSLSKCPTLGHAPEIFEGDARETGLPQNCVDAVITHPPYIGSIPYAEYGALSLTWLGYDPKALDGRLTGGRRQSGDVLIRFERDYGAMLREAHRVLKPGKHLFVLVGHPLVKGKRVNLSDMTCDLAEQAGLTLVARAARAGVNRRANKMGEEDLLFFLKR